MAFMTGVKAVFSKYVILNGRALRFEYQCWTLFSIIVSFVAFTIDDVLGMFSFNLLWSLIALPLSTFEATRRSHDVV